MKINAKRSHSGVYKIGQDQSSSIEMQSKISALTQKTESLENDKNKIETELQQALKNCHDHELLVQRHEINYSHLSTEHDKLNSDYQELIEESKRDKNTTNDMQINMTKLLERASALEDNLKKAEDKINMLSTKNIFLLQEKKELAYQLEKMQAAKL